MRPRYSDIRIPAGRTIFILSCILSAQMFATYSDFRGGAPPLVPSLELLPRTIGDWKSGRSFEMDASVRDYLRPDSYIDRHYVAGTAKDVGLLVAYFKSAKSNYGPHSPRHCLPAAGWMVRSSSVTDNVVPGGTIPVNEYWMVKGAQQILVRYWYQNRRRTWAPEIMAKVYLLPDLIRYRRSEVALVRVIAPVTGHNGLDHSRRTLSNFIYSVHPLIQNQLPE